jgi:hypothetical protein
MNVLIDRERITVMLKLWRDGVDLRIPMADEFKLHFISQRKVILQNFEQVTSAWLLFIGAMSTPDHPDEMNELRSEIKQFNEWTKEEMKTLENIEP